MYNAFAFRSYEQMNALENLRPRCTYSLHPPLDGLHPLVQVRCTIFPRWLNPRSPSISIALWRGRRHRNSGPKIIKLHALTCKARAASSKLKPPTVHSRHSKFANPLNHFPNYLSHPPWYRWEFHRILCTPTMHVAKIETIFILGLIFLGQFLAELQKIPSGNWWLPGTGVNVSGI